MKKIYLKPITEVSYPKLETILVGESPLDPNNPSSGLGGNGNDPGNGGEGGDDDWGGAKGRGMWDSDGLW